MTITFVSSAIALASTTETAPRGVTAAVRTVKRDRQVLRFFGNHRWLLTDPRFSAEARRQVRVHRRSLRRSLRALAAARHRRHRLRVRRRLAAARAARPAATICRVFGPDCADAVHVARCESGLHTDAVNGQYLGLFQMGSNERRLYGHGPTAAAQARAARRYFIVSGRDWSPWSCRPR
jgi:hypothetical protein